MTVSKDIFFLNNSLRASAGGRNRAIIGRAIMLANQGHSVKILTFDFYPELFDEIKNIKARYSLSDAIDFLDFFDFLTEAEKDNGSESHLHHCLHQKQSPYEGFRFCESKNEHKGSCSFINDDTDTILEYRYLDDKNGLIRETWRQKDEKGSIDVRYYRSTDTPFLVQHFKEKDTESKVIWNKDKDQQISLPDLQTLQHYWIAWLSDKYPDAYYCLEDRNYDDLIINNRFAVQPKSIATIHGSHFLGGGRSYGIQKRLAVLLSQIDSYDAIICLTHQQKQDIINEFGPHSNLYVIKHPALIPPKAETSTIKTDGQRSGLVMLSRLSPEKQVDHAIKAMAIVHSEEPDIKLTIYGEGKKENKLSALIKKLHLEDTVVLAGYDSKPVEKLQHAKVSLLTSKTEALSMAIIESLSVGTPCISYNCNYGPSEMIIDGKNGRLVEPDNIEELARVILETFRNPSQLKQMSQYAPSSFPEEFTNEYIATQWTNLLEDIDSKRRYYPEHIIPTAPVASLSKSEIEYKGAEVFRFNLQCSIDFPQEALAENKTKRFFLRIPHKPDEQHLKNLCFEEGERSESNQDTIIFSFNLSSREVKTIIEANPTFSIGVLECGHYVERAFKSSFVSEIISKALPHSNKQTADRLAEAILSSVLTNVESYSLSSNEISFEGGLTSEQISDIDDLNASILFYRQDDISVIAAQSPVTISVESKPTHYHWSANVSFCDTNIAPLTPQMKKQYWKIVLELTYKGQRIVRTKGFKPFATLKAGFLTIASYQGKKVLLNE